MIKNLNSCQIWKKLQILILKCTHKNLKLMVWDFFVAKFFGYQCNKFVSIAVCLQWKSQKQALFCNQRSKKNLIPLAMKYPNIFKYFFSKNVRRNDWQGLGFVLSLSWSNLFWLPLVVMLQAWASWKMLKYTINGRWTFHCICSWVS